jgi:hypothetical protein
MVMRNLMGDLKLQNPSGPVTVADPATLGTALNSAVTVDVSDTQSLTVQVRTGATAGGALIVEGVLDPANASTWAPLPAVFTSQTPSLLGGGNTGTMSANANYRFRVDVSGVSLMRIRVATALPVALASLAYLKHVDAPATSALGGTQSISGSVTNTPATPSAYSFELTAATFPTTIKTSAGSLFEVSLFNPTTATIYFKLYNKASGPTVGTDAPLVTIPVPAGQLASMDLGAVGKRFTTGISFAQTAGAAKTDTVAPAAGLQLSLTYI